MGDWQQDGSTERVVVATERSPAAIRQVIADEGARTCFALCEQLDAVLMGEADLAHETIVTLPGGTKVRLEVSLSLVDGDDA